MDQKFDEEVDMDNAFLEEDLNYSQSGQRSDEMEENKINYPKMESELEDEELEEEFSNLLPAKTKDTSEIITKRWPPKSKYNAK